MSIKAEYYIARLYDLRKIVFDKLAMTPLESLERKEYLESMLKHCKELAQTELELEHQLAKDIDDKDREVTRKIELLNLLC